MEIKPIHTDQDYETALAEIERIFDALPGTEAGDRLEVLLTLVEAYEQRHFSLPLPDPIEAIFYHLDRLGLTRKDLESSLGSRARVSEILNRRRPLTLRMIRNLSARLGISAQALLQEYPLAVDPPLRYPAPQGDEKPTYQVAERDARNELPKKN
jgi:HTH-type transcriptional regulator/antitoxin HigA